MGIARGIRNNNPLNIRHSNDKWRGQLAYQSDPEFVQFMDFEHGFRAAGRILKTYKTKYGLESVSDVISRWAPPNENDTDNYIAYVSDYMDKPEFEELSEGEWPKLLQAMAIMETGQTFEMTTIQNGLNLT